MSVYVGVPMWPFGRMIMCHMVADTEDELDAMARSIGISRRWKQQKEKRGIGGLVHYDICKSKRRLAVKAGAVELDDIAAEAKVLNRLANQANPPKKGRARGA